MPGSFRLKYPFSSVATQRLLLLKKNILARKSPPWHFNIFFLDGLLNILRIKTKIICLIFELFVILH